MSLVEIEKRLKEISKNIKVEAVGSLKMVANDLAIQSLEECPLDTGELRESLRININYDDYIKGSKDGPVVIGEVKNTNQSSMGLRASYDTEYALIQHEELSFNHPTPGTKAKYLEDPLKENRDNFIETIKEGIREGIR